MFYESAVNLHRSETMGIHAPPGKTIYINGYSAVLRNGLTSSPLHRSTKNRMSAPWMHVRYGRFDPLLGIA